jgi:hypothetical protein
LHGQDTTQVREPDRSRVRSLRSPPSLGPRAHPRTAGRARRPVTIRRLEFGSFSPSLDTLVKLNTGLRLDFATLFVAFELREVGTDRELLALARSLTPAELAHRRRAAGRAAHASLAVSALESFDRTAAALRQHGGSTQGSPAETGA